MGNKARRRRKLIKARARAEGLTKEGEKDWVKPRTHTTPMGFKVDEFGEVRRVETKAEARERFLRARSFRALAFQGALESLTRKATQDIQAEEDARVFALLYAAAGLTPEKEREAIPFFPLFSLQEER